MEREEKLLKEYEEKLNYLYAKATTISKKKRILYDLFNFSRLCYEHFGIEKTFAWDNDIEMIKLIEDDTLPFAENTLEMKDTLKEGVNKSVDTFIEVNYPFYKDYNKLLNGLTELEVQEITFDFLNNYDPKLLINYKEKLEQCEIFDVSIYKKFGYSGLTYPFESLKKNLIFCDTDLSSSVLTASILMHEYGHSFEYDIMYNCGISQYGKAIDRLPYSEVSSRFFEYAFLKFLKENKIYENDTEMCLRGYYKTLLTYIYKMSIIYEMDFVNINIYGYAEIKEPKTSEYANKTKEKLNYYSLPSEIGEEIAYRDSFLYGIGGLFSIYLYENYKQDPNYFKKEFTNALINYRYNDIEAFKNVGVTPEILTDGKILKKVLKEIK